MKRLGSISIFLSLLLSLADGSAISYKKSVATPALEPSTNVCVHVGRIISVQGVVWLKRQGWPEYHLTASGAPLCLGDRLQLAFGARAIVQCADPSQNLWTVPGREILSAASGCPPPTKPAYTLTHPITPTREPLASGVPEIISPNNTLLLSNKPTLRWIAVPGAITYVVRISGPWVNWMCEVKATQIVYSGPPLKPVEEGYLLEVEANNDEVAKATFSLLGEPQAALVRKAAVRISQQNLPADAKTLALAEIDIGQGLIAEATDLLEAAVARGSRTASVYYTLGELYANAELFRQAEGNYFKASKLAKAANDIEGQATSAARLSQVYNLLGKSDQAKYWSKHAQQEYQALGEVQPTPQG